MSRKKGKSERRIKDWQQFQTEDSVQDGAVRREKLAPKSVKLYSGRLAALEENLEELPRAEGMVIGLFPGGALVHVEGGQIQCAVAKMFRAPEGSSALAVGDEVTVALADPSHSSGKMEAEKLRADGMILSRHPRRTALSRPQPTSGKRQNVYETEMFEKVIVANMDVLLIVAATCQPPLRHGLIDRFLISAERGELRPILAINKTDLAMPDEQVLADFLALGIQALLVSAFTGQGIDALAAALAGHRSVLAGASGVGKSTLINALVPSAKAATRQVRSKDDRGRHTTSAASLYQLPGGGVLVDTPGIREMGIRIDAAELPWYFPEFEPLVPHCRFRDCTHTHEPDCAVIAAAEEGKILPRRYESYLRILQTMQEE